MPSSRRADASIAFSVTDNLSQSIVAMKNSRSEFRNDAAGLQKQLDTLDKTKIQLKNVDLKQAKQELQQAEKAIRELGDAATEADRAAANANFERASQNYENIRAQLDLTSRQARQTQKDLLDATGAISKAENRAGSSVGGAGSVLTALGEAGLFSMAGDAAGVRLWQRRRRPVRRRPERSGQRGRDRVCRPWYRHRGGHSHRRGHRAGLRRRTGGGEPGPGVCRLLQRPL